MYKIVALDNDALCNNILKSFKKEDIIEYNMSKFKDGEIFVELNEPARGDDVIIVSSISDPVNDNLMKILICADALKRASAKSIILIAPYLSYSRQDRKTRPWQPITARLVADLLQTSGITRLITFDLHAAQIEGFYSIPIDNIPISAILGALWRKSCPPNFDPGHVVVVSPDQGGVVRARAFMNSARIPNLVVVNKYREKANEISSMQIIGDVKNKTAIIVDDMIDTGGTLMKSAKGLKDLGANDIYVFATHGVFSDNAIERLSNCEYLKNVIVTNTIDKQKDLINNKINYVDLTEVVIGIIDTFRNENNVNNLYNYLVKLSTEGFHINKVL